jgi:hypothetical protein
MALEEPIQVQEPPEPAAIEKGERGRSTIGFPYLPLDDAIQVARAVHTVGGTHCQVDQLAAHLNLPSDASMFNLRLNTARIFGLVTRTQGVVTLTILGTRICDPQQEAAARAESFLFVPLYAKIYEQFKGASLPPASGLETAIGNMGVAEKQKSNARQVFQRAALQAGFSAYPGRLVYPPIKGAASAVPAPEVHTPAPEPDRSQDRSHDRSHDRKNNGGGGDGGDQHPFIQGLIKTLPAPDSPWPMDKRAQWLQAAVSVFNLIYTDDAASGRIEVHHIRKESAQ